MALIHCPECGKEISDRAEQCPNCGYPIDKGNTISTNKVEVEGERVFSNKKVFIAIIIILLIAVVGIITLNNKNPYKEYISYIGKDADELPSEYKKQEVMDGYWVASKDFKKGKVQFSNKAGNIMYFYSKAAFDAYDAKPNEVFSMTWTPEYTSIDDSVVKKELNSLEKIWGKYDSKNQWDNTSDGYSYKDDDFLITNYMWHDKKGKEIIMRVEQEGDEYESIKIDIRKKQVET